MSNQLALFDYTALDAETRIVVQQRTDEIRGLMRRAAQDIVDIGHKLLDVKARLQHGHFGAWLAAEFEWSDETARRFMNVAQQFSEIPQIVEIAPSALYLLAENATPAPARQEALERASTGTPITYQAAREIVNAHKEARREERRAALWRPDPTPIADRPIVVQSEGIAWLADQPLCDLLLTDPPYMTDVADITAFAHSWLPSALARVKPAGRAYVCIGAYPEELRAYLTAPATHMQLIQILPWTYRNTIGPSPTYDYKLNWQAILYFRGPDAPPLDCPSMIEQFSVQDINAPDGRLDNRYHAWQKPDELGERLIRHSTQAGALMLDPFCGTGTFVLAAHRLGRQAYGADIDPSMLAIAEMRGCHYAK